MPQTISEVIAGTAEKIDSWDDFQRFYDSLVSPEMQGRSRWCFRGHRSADWKLETSLDRTTRGNKDRADAEEYFIRSFQRKAHHFLDTTPASDDLLEWLALMQHWGVPTRLLDFTASPYIALFFALNEYVRSDDAANGELAAIWAVHHVACKRIAIVELNKSRIEGLPELFYSSQLGDRNLFKRCFFGNHRANFVAPVQPFLINERQSVQQGLFLCPSNIRLSFEENLVQPESFQDYAQAVSPGAPSDAGERVLYNLRNLIRKAVITANGARDILPRLYTMNLNSGSLYPDLRGYAASIVERYRALQLLPGVEKRMVGFSTLNEFDSWG